MGEKKPSEHKHEKSPMLEYEDFGEPAMYLWAVLSVLVMFAAIAMFAVLVAGGAWALTGGLDG